MSHAARSRLIEAQATHLAPPRLEGYSLSVGAKGDTYTIALQQSLHLRRVEDEQALKRTTNVPSRAAMEQVANGHATSRRPGEILICSSMHCRKKVIQTKLATVREQIHTIGMSVVIMKAQEEVAHNYEDSAAHQLARHTRSKVVDNLNHL